MSKLLLHFGFDEAGKCDRTAVSGEAGGEAFIDYVFNHAKYKKSEAAERVPGITGNALKLDGYSTFIKYDSITAESGSITVTGWIAPRTWNMQHSGGAPIAEQLDAEAKRGFFLGFGDYGKLKAIPTQRKKERIVLEVIAEAFEYDRIYTEREVNIIIADFHDDFCTIRRDMVSEKLLERENSQYKRIKS